MPAPTNQDRAKSNQDRNRKGGGGRQQGGRRPRQPKEFEEATLAIDRVTRVVKGGRRMRFRAVVVIGNKKGKVGVGTGKSGEVQGAIQKAVRAAKRDMIRIPLRNGTVPHEVNIKYKAARLRLMPASAGTGIVAGGALRTVLDMAGISDILSKRFGTKNKLVNAQAAMLALKMLRGDVVDDEPKKEEKKDDKKEVNSEKPVKKEEKKEKKDDEKKA